MACNAADATGHVTVAGGPHDGRCLAVVCRRCASPEDDGQRVRTMLVAHAMLNLIDVDLGPGPWGEPEVWHRDHLDPLPQHHHDGGQL